MSTDPLAEDYEDYTPYQFASNQPVHANEVEGLENAHDLNKRIQTRESRTIVNDAISRNTQMNRTVERALSAPTQVQTASRQQSMLSKGSTPEQSKANAAKAAGIERAKNVVSNHDNLGSPHTQNSVMVGAGYGALDVATGEVVGKVVGGLSKISNPVPKTLARVVPGDLNPTMLGAPSADDVFVTAASDISGLNATQIATKLTIPESPSGFNIITFETPKSGISSPINRTNPGFVGGGKTMGGAREFAIPNQPVPNNAVVKKVK